MKGIQKFFTDLKDTHLRCVECDNVDDFILEECDGLDDLIHNIQIQLYDNSIKSFSDIGKPAHIENLKSYYIEKTTGEKITLDMFIPFIWDDDVNGEYRMEGDEIFDDYR